MEKQGQPKMKIARINAAEGRDRISELPDPIIHDILFHLRSTKEVARTALLSKRWRRLWYSYPILDFDENLFVKPEWCNLSRKFVYKPEERIKFHKYVDGFLKRSYENKFPIRKFIVDFHIAGGRRSPVGDRSELVGNWIKVAIGNFVEEIFIRNCSTRLLEFPGSILTAKSLKSLTLVAFQFSDDLLKYGISLNSLRILRVHGVRLKGEVLHYILSNCPTIEELFLCGVTGVKNLQVTNHHNLKTLQVTGGEGRWGGQGHSYKKIVIDAPRLEKLSLGSFGCKGNSNVEVISSPNLTVLELSDDGITEEHICECILRFPRLEILCLSLCHSLEKLSLLSDSIKEIQLMSCYKLNVVEIDAPNLARLYYENEKLPEIFTVKNTAGRWEAYLAPRPLVKQIEFLSNPCPFQVLNLRIYSGTTEEELKLEDLENPDLFLRVPEVYHLKLDVSASSAASFAATLKSLLWSCHPTLLTFTQSTDAEYIEFFCNEMLNKTESNCCASSHIKCWRHQLKDVQKMKFKETDTKRVSPRDWFSSLDPLPVRAECENFGLKLIWN